MPWCKEIQMLNLSFVIKAILRVTVLSQLQLVWTILKFVWLKSLSSCELSTENNDDLKFFADS